MKPLQSQLIHKPEQTLHIDESPSIAVEVLVDSCDQRR